MTKPIRLLLLLTAELVMVKAWSVRAPESVVFRQRFERSHKLYDTVTPGAQQIPPTSDTESGRRDTDLSDPPGQQNKQFHSSISPREQHVNAVWPEKSQTQWKDNLVRKTRYLPPGASVTYGYHRKDYGLDDIVLKATPLRPVASDIAKSRREERVKGFRSTRRYHGNGFRPQPSTTWPRSHSRSRLQSQSRLQSRTQTKLGAHRLGSLTTDLERLYASRSMSAAPERSSQTSFLPPLPPVYRNLCRRRRRPAALAALPAPLRSICSDFWASRGRHVVPRVRAAPHVPPGHVYVGPTPEAAAAGRRRRHPKMDSRDGGEFYAIRRRDVRQRSADIDDSRRRSSFRNTFYKPYWPYKKNGRRYYK